MPKAVSEIPQGNQFNRTTGEGRVADSAVRSFRIILQSPSEVFDIQQSCGVAIGDPHPTNTNIACVSFDARYDGDSRTTLVASFTYQSAEAASASAGSAPGGPKTISPDIRPARWSISTELTEVPVREWKPVLKSGSTFTLGTKEVPRNPAGDLYEGVTRLVPSSSIKFQQFVLGTNDPTRLCNFVGSVNDRTIQIGSFTAAPRTLMFRSFTTTPTVESFGRLVFRGWNVELTLLHRSYGVLVSFDTSGEGDNDTEVDIGWDLPIIVEGRNVICINPAAPQAWEDPIGQPCKPGDDRCLADPLELADGVSVGDHEPACVSIPPFGARGLSQAVASEPIALNLNGSARKISDSRQPLVKLYNIYPAIDMVTELGLRLD